MDRSDSRKVAQEPSGMLSPQGTSQVQSGWVHGPLTNQGPHQTCPCLHRLGSLRGPYWSEAAPPRPSEPVLRPTPSCREQSEPTLLQSPPMVHLTEPEPGVSTHHLALPLRPLILLTHQPCGATGPLHWELAVLTTLRATSPAFARPQLLLVTHGLAGAHAGPPVLDTLLT